MRLSNESASRPLAAGISMLLILAAVAHAADDSGLPDLSTVTAPGGKGTSSVQASTGKTGSAKTSDSAAAKTTAASSATLSAASSTSVETFQVTSGPAISTTSISVFHLTGLPTIAGAGIPTVIVPDLSKAAFMQKSNLPDGTVFICVGAALGFMGAAILAWRGLVAWSLHRSVKRAAMNQHLAISETKGAYANTGSGTRKSKSFYAAVGASSTMSLDRLSAAPPPHSKPPRPFSANPNGTPPKPTPSSSLFFSPTAGAGLHSNANRSSSYLPAGYYASGAAQPASGGQTTHVGGAGGPPSSLLSMGPAAAGYSRARSIGISPPASPSLPPSRGNPYDRPPGSRGESVGYARSSVAGTLGGGIYGHSGLSASNLSLNAPGGTQAPGGRAPSAYLEDLFENHGNGPRERF